MSNIEQAARAMAAALTGKKEDEIPENLEEIFMFVATNYNQKPEAETTPSETPPKEGAAPAGTPPKE